METQYEVLGFEDFSKETSKLLNIYDALTKRFVSLPLPKLIETLLTTLNAYKGDRTTQAKVLTQLALELRNDPNLQAAVQGSGDKNYVEHAQQILLGALIHRYYRIKSEYDNTDKVVETVTGFGFMTSMFKKVVYNPKPEDCKLYVAIKKILDITFQNTLDDLTIVSACSAFRAYMEKDDKYTTYEHFKTVDANFFENIDLIIEDGARQKVAGPMLIESNKLRFLDKISFYLGGVQTEMLDCLNQIIKFPLKKDVPLSRVWIEERLKALKIKEPIQKRMLYLLENEGVKSNLCEWTQKEFCEKLSEFVQSYSSYALFGAYLVILYDNGPKSSEAFNIALKTALHCNARGNTLDNNSSLIGLESLKSWFMCFEKDAPFSQWALYENSQSADELFDKAFTRVESNIKKNSEAELETEKQQTLCTL